MKAKEVNTTSTDRDKKFKGSNVVPTPAISDPNGVNVGMGDGSVRFIKNSISIFTFQALASAKGSEIVSSDSY